MVASVVWRVDGVSFVEEEDRCGSGGVSLTMERASWR
jgi:hypothetical protein